MSSNNLDQTSIALKDLDERQRKGYFMVVLYPFVVFFIALLINHFALGFENVSFTEMSHSRPSQSVILAFSTLAIVMILNHSWLMTATEIVRVKFKLYATPEEWQQNKLAPENASLKGKQELERTHNAHRNTNENTLYFLLLAVPFIFVNPSSSAAWIWLVGFGVARLGYTYAYLAGSDNLRGLFMTLGLLACYGVAEYLVAVLVFNLL